MRKSFGSIEALRGVDLDLWPGEVLGLVGDNAAGKSTLTKILAGAYLPDEGTIELDGRPVRFGSPAEARARRVEMVYQDLSLCDTVDVAGNLFLGREPTRNVLGLRLLEQAEDAVRGARDARLARDPHSQPQGAGCPALGRPAPVDRDRPRLRLRADGADHGRADLGAGGGRGRCGPAPDPAGQGARASRSS